MVTIKPINVINDFYETYFIILIQKVKENNKLIDISNFFSDLEDKVCLINLILKVNVIKWPNISWRSVFSRNDSNFHVKSGGNDNG